MRFIAAIAAIAEIFVVTGIGGSRVRADPAGAPCLSREQLDWSFPELGVAADGDRAIVCFRSGAVGEGETCVTVEPVTGKIVGSATWPSKRTPDRPNANTYKVTVEAKTVVVCGGGTCRRVRDVMPDDPQHELPLPVVDARGTQLVLLDSGESGVVYDVTSGKARAHFKFPFGDGPPSPGTIHEMEAFGRSILLGAFSDDGIWDRAIDPATGRLVWLMKPYVRLPHDLVAHFDWSGNATLYDFDDHLRVVARRAKAGKPRNKGEGVTGDVVVVGDDALIVTRDPPATMFVDSAKRTISKPRPLLLCPKS